MSAGFVGDHADGSDYVGPVVVDTYIGGGGVVNYYLINRTASSDYVFDYRGADSDVVDKKSKKGTLMQIQSDTISAAKAALNPVRANIMPQKQNKRPVSYAQLARSIHELAATSDQKSSQKQLVHHVFPKLAVYNSVDPSLAPSLLMGWIDILIFATENSRIHFVAYF